MPVIVGSAGPNDRLYETRHAAVHGQRACNDRRQVIDLRCIVVVDNTQNNNLPNCKSSINESTKTLQSRLYRVIPNC